VHLSPDNLESLAEPVVLLDAAGMVVVANSRCLGLLALPRQNYSGRPAGEFPLMASVLSGLRGGGCRFDELEPGRPVSLRLPVGESGADLYVVEVHRLAGAWPPGIALIFRRAVTDRTSGRGRVLVVDDDDMVRKITAAVLRQQDFEVLEACDGEDALTKWFKESGNFDLVLLDIHMPQLGGLEVHERMRAASPGVKVVFLSGSMGDMPSDLPARGAGYQQKPFHNEELIATVRQALGVPHACQP
jgi:CheY-like chemotaxis protein